jgi:hypothetical protein
MHIVRKGLLILIAPLFSLLLFALALDVGILRVASHPQKVKQLISESGIYNTLIPGILDQQAKQTSSSGDVNLTDPAIKQAANAAFSPQVLQTDTEKIIDGVYHWLNGTTTTPDFKVDLSASKQTFADQVAQATKTKAASLPRCTSVSTNNSFDAFSATCLPPGVTPDQAAAQIKSSLLGGKGFLDNPVITADTVKGDNPSKDIFQDNLKSAPKNYQRIKKTPVVLAILAVLMAAAIVLLSPRKLLGVRRVGITLLTLGIFMLIFSWGVNRAIQNKILPQLKINNSAIQTDVRKLLGNISGQISSNYRVFGILYTVLGVGAIGGTMFIHRKQTQPTTVAANGENDVEPKKAKKGSESAESTPANINKG